METAEREFAATMVVLEEKREQVRMLEKKLADLNSTLDSAQAKKKQLENDVNLCSNKLYKARRLVGKKTFTYIYIHSFTSLPASTVCVYMHAVFAFNFNIPGN